MNLREVPTERLRQILAATELAGGRDGVSARIFRRELTRRESVQRNALPHQTEGAEGQRHE